MNQRTAQATPFSRELDKGEYFFFLHNKVLASNVTAIAEGSGALPVTDLHTFLLRLQQRHPLLQCKVVEASDSRPVFAQDSEQKIPLEELQCPEADWQLAVAKASSEILPADKGPLCKLLLLKDGNDWCLALIVNHIICDGRSVMALLKEYLLLLSGCSLVDLEYLPTVAVETASATTRGLLKDTLNTLYYRFLAPYLLARKGEMSVPQEFEINEQRSDCRSLLLDWNESESASIRELCRQHEVSVGAILAAMLLKALRKEVAGSGPTPLGITTTVDLRKRLTPAIEENRLQLYAGSVLTTFSLSGNEDLWELAKSMQRDVKTKVERNIGCDWWCWLPTCLDSPPHQDVPERFLFETCGHSYQSPTFSNLGVIDDCSGITAFDIKRLYMFGNPMLNDPYILIAGSFRGRLWLNLCVNCAKLPEPVMHRTASSLKELVEKVLLESKS